MGFSKHPPWAGRFIPSEQMWTEIRNVQRLSKVTQQANGLYSNSGLCLQRPPSFTPCLPRRRTNKSGKENPQQSGRCSGSPLAAVASRGLFQAWGPPWRTPRTLLSGPPLLKLLGPPEPPVSQPKWAFFPPVTHEQECAWILSPEHTQFIHVP